MNSRSMMMAVTVAAIVCVPFQVNATPTTFEVTTDTSTSDLDTGTITGTFGWDGDSYSKINLKYDQGDDSSVTSDMDFGAGGQVLQSETEVFSESTFNGNIIQPATTAGPSDDGLLALKLENFTQSNGDEIDGFLALDFQDSLALSSEFSTEFSGGFDGGFADSTLARVREGGTGGQRQNLTGAVTSVGETAAIPLPSTLALLGAGLFSLGLAWRRRRDA